MHDRVEAVDHADAGCVDAHAAAETELAVCPVVVSGVIAGIEQAVGPLGETAVETQG